MQKITHLLDLLLYKAQSSIRGGSRIFGKGFVSVKACVWEGVGGGSL